MQGAGYWVGGVRGVGQVGEMGGMAQGSQARVFCWGWSIIEVHIVGSRTIYELKVGFLLMGSRIIHEVTLGAT